MGAKLRKSCAALLFALALPRVTALINFSQNTPNPFQGQNLPPKGYSYDDYPVQVYALIEDVYQVDERAYTYSLVFGLLLQYEDPQTVAHIMEDSSTDCQFYCASDPTVILNSEGLPACCDKAFVPAVQAVNLISYGGGQVPAEYQLSLLSNTTVAYYSRTLGTFSTDLEYAAYPWDKHYLSVDFRGTFTVEEGSGTFVSRVNARVTSDSSFPNGLPPGYNPERPSLTAIDLPAWKVINTHFELMEFDTAYGKGGKSSGKGGVADLQGTLPEFAAHGFRVSIEVEREQTGFYIVVEILPICLIVGFSFSIFALPVTSLKARSGVLAGQFLTIIVLQFILDTTLPATYQLINPYLLICVSYFMIFALCLEVIAANTLLQRYNRHSRHQAAKKSRSAYLSWKGKILEEAATLYSPMKSGLSRKVAHNKEEEAKGTDLEKGSVGSHADSGSVASSVQPSHHQAAHMDAPTDVEDDVWLQKQKSIFWRIPWTRDALLAWQYMQRPDSKEFCYQVAKAFDRTCAGVMAVTYLACVIIIFTIAETRANPRADTI